MATRQSQKQVGWVFAAQAVLLLVAAMRNLEQMNPDAIAYLRIAGYYAEGKLDLAVTGYWGPLLSWLLAPLLKPGIAPLVAARLVMSFSAVIFLAGVLAVFRSFRLPARALLWGLIIAALNSVFWSVRNIVPDLLVAGLIGLAVSATMSACRLAGPVKSERDRRSMRAAGIAGIWWGVAYLAKAVALPLALLVVGGLVWACGRRRGWPVAARHAAVMGTTLLLVAGPWLAVLSWHYGKPTFSTTGPIAHALAGPGEEARYHPAMVTLHRPDAGRVTQWEEPSRMAYRMWSPLASGENFVHQLRVAGDNAGTLVRWLSPVLTGLLPGETTASPQYRFVGFDLCGLALLGVIGAVAACVWHRCGARKWRWALWPVVCLGGLYSPFWVQREDSRYLYPAFPFLWVMAVGAWGWLTGGAKFKRLQQHRGAGFCILTFSFAAPAMIWWLVAWYGIPNPASRAAHELAAQLKSTGVHGPLAGSGILPGGRTGLYLAFLLGEPWLGDTQSGGPAEFLASGAKLVVLRRGSAQAEALARDLRWRVLPAENLTLAVQLFVVRDKP